MSNETLTPNDMQPGGGQEELSIPELTDRARTEPSVAKRIALILADPNNSVLLETLYEGSTFTSTMTHELGFMDADEETNALVKDGLSTLKKEKVIRYERQEIDEIHTINQAEENDTVRELSIGKSLIQVILAPKVNDFIQKRERGSKK